MKDIQVKITTKHFRNSDGYAYNHTCPLALAVKDVINDPKAHVSVVCGRVTITKGKRESVYSVTLDWQCHQEIYGGMWKNKDINDMINESKANPKLIIPTRVLELKYVFTHSV